jgi:hypothetical protein
VNLAVWGPWIGGLIAAVGGAAGIASFIKARPEAKKLDADAAKVIQETSADMIKTVRESVREDLVALRARVAELEQDRKDRDRRDEMQYRRLRVHQSWDEQIARKLRELGEDIADPPPLYPDPTPA